MRAGVPKTAGRGSRRLWPSPELRMLVTSGPQRSLAPSPLHQTSAAAAQGRLQLLPLQGPPQGWWGLREDITGVCIAGPRLGRCLTTGSRPFGCREMARSDRERGVGLGEPDPNDPSPAIPGPALGGPVRPPTHCAAAKRDPWERRGFRRPTPRPHPRHTHNPLPGNPSASHRTPTGRPGAEPRPGHAPSLRCLRWGRSSRRLSSAQPRSAQPSFTSQKVRAPLVGATTGRRPRPQRPSWAKSRLPQANTPADACLARKATPFRWGKAPTSFDGCASPNWNLFAASPAPGKGLTETWSLAAPHFCSLARQREPKSSSCWDSQRRR